MWRNQTTERARKRPTRMQWRSLDRAYVNLAMLVPRTRARRIYRLLYVNIVCRVLTL